MQRYIQSYNGEMLKVEQVNLDAFKGKPQYVLATDAQTEVERLEGIIHSLQVDLELAEGELESYQGEAI